MLKPSKGLEGEVLSILPSNDGKRIIILFGIKEGKGCSDIDTIMNRIEEILIKTESDIDVDSMRINPDAGIAKFDLIKKEEKEEEMDFGINIDLIEKYQQIDHQLMLLSQTTDEAEKQQIINTLKRLQKELKVIQRK